MNKDRLNVYNNYIKKYSLSGFKFGLKYAAYLYIGATMVGLVAGFISPLLLIFDAIDLANFLILPLYMIMTNFVTWTAIGVIFIAAFGVAMSIAKPFFHLTKDLINERRAQKKENGEEKDIKLQALQDPTPVTPVTQARPKTPDRDSGTVTPETAIAKDSFVDKTNNGDYHCWLSNFNIESVARIVYGYSPGGIKNDVFFSIPISYSTTQYTKTLLEKYKQEVEKNHNLIFTSVLYLVDKKHFATLVVAYSNQDQKFRAYYSDSYFNSPLPDKVSDTIQEILNVEKGDIRSYYTKQQEDTWNCGIFALENAKIITDALKVGESFDEIDAKLKYTLSPEQLIEKRKEFAEALKKDEQSIVRMPSEKNRRSSVASSVSSVSLDSGHGSDEESKQTQKTEVKAYDTVGDGNCFFHSVFGKKDCTYMPKVYQDGVYRAESAQKMREEWHKFLSQFTSLNDPRMPKALKEQLQTVFNMFLNKPGDLTGKSDTIKELAEQTNKKIKNAEDSAKELVNDIVSGLKVPQNEAIGNLREYAEALNPDNFDEDTYRATYNSDTITNSFLNDEVLYKSYLEAISKQAYYVFAEEIPILASLAGIKITVHYKDNGNNVHKVFEPNPEMMKMNMFDEAGEVHTEVYKRNSELWGDKEEETIYLKPGHYERAEIVEVEPSLVEQFTSVVQVVVAACTSTVSLNKT